MPAVSYLTFFLSVLFGDPAVCTLGRATRSGSLAVSNRRRLDFISFSGQNRFFGRDGADKNRNIFKKIRMPKKIVLNPAYILEAESLNGPVDWAALFGRTAPVQIEIGSGKGTFLVHQAAAFPQTDFLGIEWSAEYCRLAADRIARHRLTNVRMIRTDAADFLRRHVADGTVEMIHLYFPDPWPKRRHHKRRFFSRDNLHQMLRCLQPGGWINFATDHADYYEQARRIAQEAQADGRVETVPFIRPAGAREGEMTGTNYERKYLKEGRAVYTLTLRKSEP
ncbi:MAG TPA: tRNA (guanosine(46)-N7)-methyltransferase TrmB [Anaerohalosphaeraceae bacterium]|nr:tRNA (guanosine(46)-N7)-methyltransferase TrmB [Anaerohalosphaeraceae bacterium]HPP56081.1 tRNA (guanosine(46)-N7)-methyltransferase TrmB [Anaerohalosphaeraceae bacterium]